MEAWGQKKPTVTSLREAEESSEEEIEQLRQRLRELEMETALKRISSIEGDDQSHLGPTVFVDVEVNGVKTTALVDTGSPATIISLDFVMQIVASQRHPSIPIEKWRKQTLERFLAPDVALKSYGGHRVDIVSQTSLQLTLGEKQIDTIVLVQKGAPNNLLLGTDTQPRLGIALVIQRVDMLTHSPVATQNEDRHLDAGRTEISPEPREGEHTQLQNTCDSREVEFSPEDNATTRQNSSTLRNSGTQPQDYESQPQDNFGEGHARSSVEG